MTSESNRSKVFKTALKRLPKIMGFLKDTITILVLKNGDPNYPVLSKKRLHCLNRRINILFKLNNYLFIEKFILTRLLINRFE